MAGKFKIGDLVRAKGLKDPPDMVVAGFNLYDEDVAVCFWFSGKKRETAEFHEDTLELAPAPGSKP